ncbi:hypothetical protein LMTR13_10945 [Bradyrhizobium icense]|uniref:Uncharacterized protein n=1 Tax=Bradyrhizobium icense TaxID=1274631 RepID=A0A1B1UD58_9BRAD|nr:hypothetical protein LMTR13_10945 [Bradyrhizobium icense]
MCSFLVRPELWLSLLALRFAFLLTRQFHAFFLELRFRCFFIVTGMHDRPGPGDPSLPEGRFVGFKLVLRLFIWRFAAVKNLELISVRAHNVIFKVWHDNLLLLRRNVDLQLQVAQNLEMLLRILAPSIRTADAVRVISSIR